MTEELAREFLPPKQNGAFSNIKVETNLSALNVELRLQRPNDISSTLKCYDLYQGCWLHMINYQFYFWLFVEAI